MTHACGSGPRLDPPCEFVDRHSITHCVMIVTWTRQRKHVIKKYANRKLYDTRTSRYVTLEGISELLRMGEEIQVVERDTGATSPLSSCPRSWPARRSAAPRTATLRCTSGARPCSRLRPPHAERAGGAGHRRGGAPAGRPGGAGRAGRGASVEAAEHPQPEGSGPALAPSGRAGGVARGDRERTSAPGRDLLSPNSLTRPERPRASLGRLLSYSPGSRLQVSTEVVRIGDRG